MNSPRKEPALNARDHIGIQTICAAFAVRLALLCTGIPEILRRRVEIATPLTSLLRLTEGKWLLHHGLSPYAGSSYHGLPLLLAIGGSDSVWPYLVADLISALLLYSSATLLTTTSLPAQTSETTHDSSPEKGSTSSDSTPPTGSDGQKRIREDAEVRNEDGQLLGRWTALLFLLNPLSISACVGGSTAPLENLLVLFALRSAVASRPSLAALGWTLSTWLALYPLLLLMPISLLLVNGRDGPKSLRQNRGSGRPVRWGQLALFAIWSLIWNAAMVGGSWWILRDHGGLTPFFTKSWGFIIGVRELNPNIGVCWYFFTEMFSFFRPFYLYVFPAIPAVLLSPLTLRLHHRPLFTAFLLLTLTAIIKPYPSVADAALYLGLLPLFVLQLQDMRFVYVLFIGFLYVYILGPIMFNLWIWQGTGNANFYYAVGMVYVCVQGVLIVESINAMLTHDRKLKYEGGLEKKI